MQLTIPLVPKESSLSGDWFRLEHGSNSALVNCINGRVETLIYVVFGDDFIAGLRVDRRTWVLVPSAAVASVTFKHLGAHWLPPIRQTSEEARGYLQGLGSADLQVWTKEASVPLPASRGAIQGRWLVLSRTEDGTAERLVAFESITLIEVMDVASAIGDLDSTWIRG